KGQGMTRQKLLDALEERVLADRVLEGQILGQRGRIGFYIGEKRQQRFGLRCEEECVPDDSIVKRLDAEPVPCAEQPPAIPESEGKHAAQVLYAFEAVTLVRPEDHLRVGAAAELPVSSECLAQLEIVVDFPVVGNDR